MTDGHGNVVGLADSSERRVNMDDYNPYGEPVGVGIQETVPQNFRLAGLWGDNELGENYVGDPRYEDVSGIFDQPIIAAGTLDYLFAHDDSIDRNIFVTTEPMASLGGGGFSGFLESLWRQALRTFRVWIGPLEQLKTDPHYNLHITNPDNEDYNNWHIRVRVTPSGNLTEYEYEATNYAESEQAFNPGNLLQAVEDEFVNRTVVVRTFVSNALQPAARAVQAAESAYYNFAQEIAAKSQLTTSQAEEFVKAITEPTTVQAGEEDIKAGAGALEYVMEQFGQLAEEVPPP